MVRFLHCACIATTESFFVCILCMAALIPAYIKSENTSTQTRHLRQKREKVTPKSVVILSPHKVHFNVELIQFDGHTRSFIVNQLDEHSA